MGQRSTLATFAFVLAVFFLSAAVTPSKVARGQDAAPLSSPGQQALVPEGKAPEKPDVGKKQEPPPFPGVAELVPRATELAKRYGTLQKTLEEAFDQAAVRKDLKDREDQIKRLAAEFRSLTQVGAFEYDLIADLRARMRAETVPLSELTKGVSSALENLEKLQQTWTESKEQWQTWKENLPRDVPRKTVESVFAEVQKTVSKALEDISKAMKPLLEFQRRAGELHNRVQALVLESEAMMEQLQGQLFRKTAPSMFSRRFYRNLSPELLTSLWTNVQKIPWPESQFFAVYGWLIILQVLVFFTISAGIFRHRQRMEREERWQFVWRAPLAAGLLVSAAAFSPLYGTPPPLWNFLLWMAAILASARLGVAAIETGWMRGFLFMLAFLFLVTGCLRLLNVLEPLLRLYLVVVSLAGASLCLWGGAVSARNASSRVNIWTLRLGAAVFGLSLVLQIAGFSALSLHLLESSIKTVFLILIAWLLTRLLQGGMEFELSLTWPQRVRVLRNNAPQIVRRTARIINLTVAAFTLALLLQVWRIYASPWEALADILSYGFSLGGLRVTGGLVLGVIAVLYGTYLISLALQALLSEEVYPRRQVDEGVGYAMNRLIHYAVVLVGFLLALSLLGVEMQNVTILMGALGIGIGFGLQNIVNNFVSGIIMLFERPIKVGDIVQLGGEWGRIMKLGLRATVVKAFAGSELIVPNSELISNVVTNWTFSDRTVRIIIKVGVAYGSDVALVMQLLQTAAEEHASVVEDPKPVVLFRGFGESSLNFELWVNISNLDQRLATESELYQAVDRKFREARVEIPFPQRDLHLRSVDPSTAQGLGLLRRDTGTPNA